jgi:hypothetical protein
MKRIKRDSDLEFLDVEDWMYAGAVAINTKNNTIVVGLTNDLM